MPGSFLTDAERERLRRFPDEVPPEDLIAYFALTDRDRGLVQKQRRDQNRLGVAMQLCALRYLGFVPARLRAASSAAVEHLARQLDVDPRCLGRYGKRSQTRTAHLQDVLAHLGFRKARTADLKALKVWLVERALEHDRPTLLFQLACERLRADKVVRPGLTRLERLVVAAQQGRSVRPSASSNLCSSACPGLCSTACSSPIPFAEGRRSPGSAARPSPTRRGRSCKPSRSSSS
jgi:hypothetical protein